MLNKHLTVNLQRPKEWVKASCGFGVAFLFIIFVSNNLKFLISETDSLSYHYFLHFPKIKPGLYDYTAIESDWYQGKIIKQIVGRSGDEIWQDKNGHIFVNQLNIGNALKISSDGKALTPIKSQTIPQGYVFLCSDHARSFDSRYEELGLVPLSSLEGLVVPLSR